MKRLVVLFAVAAFLMAGVTNCKKQEEEQKSEKSRQEQMQKTFEEHLSSYPADFKKVASEMIKAGMVPQSKKEFAIVKLQGKLTFEKEGKKYSGTLPEPVYVKVKNGDQMCMRNGAEVQDYEKKSVVSKFTIEPFKYEWGKEELDPIAQKYELTITSSGSGLPEHTGPAYETYAEFADVSEIGEPKFQVLDVKKENVQNPDERLAYLVWKDGKPFAFRKDGREWGQR